MKITTIIFDLGGVILNLDPTLTYNAFENMCKEKIDPDNPLFHDFETGKIDAAIFRKGVNNLLSISAKDNDIDEAWNAMLLDLPEERLKQIESLKEHYRIYLLSNTNSIHIDCFNQYFENKYGMKRWTTLFDKIYYSFEIGLRKPDKKIYEYVMDDIQTPAHECLFIDDNALNIQAAASAGIHTIHATSPFSMEMLANFNNQLLNRISE